MKLCRISKLAIQAFIDEVNCRAERNMLRTGKLEGSHHAAMKQVWEEWSQRAHDTGDWTELSPEQTKDLTRDLFGERDKESGR